MNFFLDIAINSHDLFIRKRKVFTEENKQFIITGTLDYFPASVLIISSFISKHFFGRTSLVLDVGSPKSCGASSSPRVMRSKVFMRS